MRRLLLGSTLLLFAAAAWAAETVSQPAYETATIQPTGPRPPSGGDDFWNIEGADNGDFASYGVVRWNLGGIQAALDAALGAGNWTITKIEMQTEQRNSGFTTDGDLRAYYTADDATDVKTGPEPQYPLVDAGVPDLPLNLADPVATFAFTEVATGHLDVVTLFDSGQGGQSAALAADVASDSVLTIVLVEDPNTPGVAATYSGQTGGPGGDPNVGAPRLIVTATTLGGNIPPVADAGPDQQVSDADESHSELVTLDGSNSLDVDGAIVRYLWTEGPTTLADTAAPMANVNLGLGVHNITLTVEDDEGDMDSDTVVITVSPNPPPPVADAGPPQEVTQAVENQPVNVSLDASGSFDPNNGTIVAYEWFEDGVTIATGVSPTVPLGAGVHTIFVEVEDNAGNRSRDVTFVKVLPPGVFARFDFDFHFDAGYNQAPAPGTFGSPADAFDVKQRLFSPSIPFNVLDDSGSADPNNECLPFPGDSQGIIMCADTDAFFAAVDLRNPDNEAFGLCDKGLVELTFNIAGKDSLEVWIDMAATGDFEAGDPNDPNGAACDPNAAGSTQVDKYDWTYAIDGGPEQPLFTSAVDEDGSVVETLFSGLQTVRPDPLLINGQVLDNTMRTQVASVSGTGSSLVVRLRARGDGGEEVYVFDDVMLRVAPASCPGDCDGNGTIDITDLGQVLTGFNQSPGPCDTDGSGTTDISDLGVLLSNFNTSCR